MSNAEQPTEPVEGVSAPAEPPPPPEWQQHPPPWDIPPPGWQPPPPGWQPPPPGWQPPPPGPAGPSRWSWLTARATGWAVAAALAGVVIGLSVSLATTSPTTVVRLPGAMGPGFGTPAHGFRAVGPGVVLPGFVGNAGGAEIVRPAQAAVLGTVTSVSTSSFTMTTRLGRTVTVKEQPTTHYLRGAIAASRSAVTTGARVLVVAPRNGTTITANEVIVLLPA